MDIVPNDFAIIGGDLRQVYMAEILSTKGYQVVTYGLTKEPVSRNGTIKKAVSLQEAVRDSSIIAGPIPFTKDSETVEILKDTLTPDKKFFAGCISEELKVFGDTKHIFMYDFMKDEELTVFNTIATAEGTIAEAILRHPFNLHGGNCLIIGFGKCASTLAHKLKGLSADITICARNKVSGAIAQSYGYKAIGFETLEEHLGSFEYIFNTVPSLVMGSSQLMHVKKHSLIIDIASAPGGIDYEAAAKMNVEAYLCLGLPGKYAPKATAYELTKVLLKYKELL